jgi:hypothetical protein
VGDITRMKDTQRNIRAKHYKNIWDNQRMFSDDSKSEKYKILENV